jgi:hypothetical protein
LPPLRARFQLVFPFQAFAFRRLAGDVEVSVTLYFGTIVCVPG